MTKKPVILLFIDWFTPGYRAGGPIASCINFIQLMKKEYAIYVFTSDTDLGETVPYKNITPDTWLHGADGDYMIYYARKNNLGLRQIGQVYKSIKPDFVYLNHMFSPKFVVYPLWLAWKGVIDCRVVLCPRGALYESALAVKPYKKIPFLVVFKLLNMAKRVRFHATSAREKDAILLQFPGTEVVTADDLPSSVQQPFTRIAKERGSLRCIFAARIHPIKNLSLLLAALQQVKAIVALTIVGPVEDQVYWQQCQAQINEMPPNIVVNYAGSLPNHALMQLLYTHHLFAMPTQGENFGHSIFESFMAGRPVLISNQTPWLQLEANHVGWDLPLNGSAGFTRVIEKAADWNQQTFDVWANNAWLYAKDFIDNRGLKEQYLKVFSE